MAVITEITNVAKSFEKLKIILDLNYHNVDVNTSMGAAIINAIESKKYSTDEIISFVKDQANDNPELMADCIGNVLCDRILNL